jgi:hypothetical protein
MFAANNATPPPPAPNAPPPVQQPDQSAITGALAQTRVPSQGGDTATMAASTDNTFLMKQWQDQNAHPVMDSKTALDWGQRFDSGISRAVYLPHGGPGGEPAYALSSGGKNGASNIVPLSQMVQNGAAPLVAAQNTSQVLSAADAQRQQQQPGMSLGTTAQAPPGMEIPGTEQAAQPPPGQPLPQPAAAQPPAAPAPPVQQPDQGAINAAVAQTRVPSQGGVGPQYLSADARRGATAPPAPAPIDAAHPYHEQIVPYPNPTTSTEHETNRQVSTGKVDKDGIATIGNAGNDSVNLTGADGMLHYTGLSADKVNQMALDAKNNQYKLGTRENADPFIGTSPSGRNYFMSDGGYAATSRPYTAEPGDTPFTEHRLYAGSDNWRDVTPAEKQLQANLHAWDPSIPIEKINAMKTPELVAQLRVAFNYTKRGTMDHDRQQQLIDLQYQIDRGHRMMNVINSGMNDNDITEGAIKSNRGASEAEGLSGTKGFSKIPAYLIASGLKAWHGANVDPKITYLDKNAQELAQNASKYHLDSEIPNFHQGPAQIKSQIAQFVKNREIDYQRILNGSMANWERVDDKMLNYGNNIVLGKENHDPDDLYAHATRTQPVATSTPSATPRPSPTPGKVIIDKSKPNWQANYDKLGEGDHYFIGDQEFIKHLPQPARR